MKKCIWNFLLLATAFTSHPSISQEAPAPSKTTMEIMEAIGKGDAKTALDKAQRGDAAGDAGSSYLLGQMYEQGRGVAKADLVKAYECYQKAADSGLREGLTAAARFLENGIHGKKDPERAGFYWQQAAEAGDPPAMSRLGFMEWQGLGRPVNFEAAKVWIQKAADAQDADGMFYLSRMLDQALAGLTRDLPKALALCARAADARQLEAMNQMGLYYQTGIGVPRDAAAAAGWFNYATECGGAAGALNLALCYENGTGVVQNGGRAFALKCFAAKQGMAKAQFVMGDTLEKGTTGVPSSPVFALAYYLRALKTNFSGAAEAVARLKKALGPKEIQQAEQLSDAPFFHLEMADKPPAAKSEAKPESKKP
jgi:uncharacterized protein